MVFTYPNRLQLAQTPTPLSSLDRLSEQLNGPRIWLKRDDMTGCGVSGNKIRKLEFTLAKAIDEGCDTIITAGGVQSNHCRTTAILCAQLGLKAHLILRGDERSPVDGNLLLDKLVGAEISFCSNVEFQKRSDEMYQEWVDHYAKQGRKAMVVPVGASDGTGVWGYVSACDELKVEFEWEGIQPSHIISATGSGGTQAGLTAGSYLLELGARVWGINVCDDEVYFLNKVAADLTEWHEHYTELLPEGFSVNDLEINVIDGYVGPGYARATPEVFDTIKQLAMMEGIILDPVYTGKAFNGMLDQIKQGRFDGSSDIVFVHTGGIFGLFPQREQLSF